MNALSRKHHLILDIMGGDRGIEAPLEGAQQALSELTAKLTFVGDEAQIVQALKTRRFEKLRRANIEVIHASEEIKMDDTIRAIRSKPKASINVGMKLAEEAYSKGANGSMPTAFISAGHSGAMMASALLNLGRIEGIERPAIAVTLPTLSPDGCLFLDVGANVDCKPEHLRDFALMGAFYSKAAVNRSRKPRVGLLSNGEEKSKGNELTRQSADLIAANSFLQKDNPNAIAEYVGYVEGKEIFKGDVDVVVTDGFVGNVVLKSLEGLGSAITSFLKQEARTNLLTTIGFLMGASAFRRLKRKLDYAEYGAAPLLGVRGYAYICHGRSNAKAFKNALLRTQSGLTGRFVENLEETLKASLPAK